METQRYGRIYEAFRLLQTDPSVQVPFNTLEGFIGGLYLTLNLLVVFFLNWMIVTCVGKWLRICLSLWGIDYSYWTGIPQQSIVLKTENSHFFFLFRHGFVCGNDDVCSVSFTLKNLLKSYMQTHGIRLWMLRLGVFVNFASKEITFCIYVSYGNYFACREWWCLCHRIKLFGMLYWTTRWWGSSRSRSVQVWIEPNRSFFHCLCSHLICIRFKPSKTKPIVCTLLLSIFAHTLQSWREDRVHRTGCWGWWETGEHGNGVSK